MSRRAMTKDCDRGCDKALELIGAAGRYYQEALLNGGASFILPHALLSTSIHLYRPRPTPTGALSCSLISLYPKCRSHGEGTRKNGRRARKLTCASYLVRRSRTNGLLSVDLSNRSFRHHRTQVLPVFSARMNVVIKRGITQHAIKRAGIK